MIDGLFARIRARHVLSVEEEEAIRATIGIARDLEPYQTFIHADTLLDSSTLIVESVACRYKDLREGQRQITALHVPGDFADLYSFYTLKRLDHSLMSLTRCRIVQVPHAPDQGHHRALSQYRPTVLVFDQSRRVDPSRMAWYRSAVAPRICSANCRRGGRRSAKRTRIASTS